MAGGGPARAAGPKPGRAPAGAAKAVSVGPHQTGDISSVTMLEQRIQQQFFDSADLKYAAAEVLSKPIADAVSALVGCITGGGKVLACGNGGGGSGARHFSGGVVGPFWG